MKYFIHIMLLFLLMACKSNTTHQYTPNLKNPNAKHTTCILVEKNFINKAGKMGDFTELYLQCSVQDYFIKICESDVSLDELKEYLNQGITVDMEIREGMWDHCSDNLAYSQSRMGTYVVIKKIIE